MTERRAAWSWRSRGPTRSSTTPTGPDADPVEIDYHPGGVLLTVEELEMALDHLPKEYESEESRRRWTTCGGAGKWTAPTPVRTPPCPIVSQQQFPILPFVFCRTYERDVTHRKATKGKEETEKDITTKACSQSRDARTSTPRTASVSRSKLRKESWWRHLCDQGACASYLC
jgi:hypothetical protein